MSGEEDRVFEKYKSPLVGEIDAIVYAADGELLDGFHRLDEGWEKKEVLEWCDTDRKKWAVKLQRNVKRRAVSIEETDQTIINLANAIIKEEGPEVIPQLVQLTARDGGLSINYVRKVFQRYPEKLSGVKIAVMPVKKRKPEKTQRPSKEKPSEEVEPVYTKGPQKGTEAFNRAVEDTISASMSMPEDVLVGRLTAIYDLSIEEAQEALASHKRKHSGVWDIQRQMMERETSKPEAPKPPELPQRKLATRIVTPEPPEEPTQYTADPAMGVAYTWYPDEVVDKIWVYLPIPSEKLQFMREIFRTCWKIAVEDYDIKDILRITNDRVQELKQG